MILKYSFGSIDPIWLPGKPPAPEMKSVEKVNVSLSVSSIGGFPYEFIHPSDLLVTRRPSPLEYHIELLIEFIVGYTAPFAYPPPVGKWVDRPNSPKFGQARIALPLEAIDKIEKVVGEGYSYELKLEHIILQAAPSELK